MLCQETCSAGLGMNNRLLVVAAGSSGHRFGIFSKVDTEVLSWMG